MDKKQAVIMARRYLLLVKNYFDVEKMYIYGSYAKGNYKQDSDIDIAVVIKSTDKDFFSTNPILWKLRREVDDRIEPILIERENDQSGFLSEIKSEGIEIKE